MVAHKRDGTRRCSGKCERQRKANEKKKHQVGSERELTGRERERATSASQRASAVFVKRRGSAACWGNAEHAGNETARSVCKRGNQREQSTARESYRERKSTRALCGCTLRERARCYCCRAPNKLTRTHTRRVRLHVQTLPANAGSDASCSSAGDLQPDMV